MIHGLTGKIPYNHEIAGFPYGVDTYGFELLSSDTDNAVKVMAGQFIRPMNAADSIFNAGSYTDILFKNGNHARNINGDALSFIITDAMEHSQRFESFTTLSVPLIADDASQSTVFKVASYVVPGTDVKLVWTPSTSLDFSYTELYWDNGNVTLPTANFPLLATVVSKSTGQFYHQNAGTGTFRYYLRFYDIYGNATPLANISLVSVTTVAIPTLDGTFTFDYTNGKNHGSFTPTTQANISYIKLFANILHGYGVIDHIQYTQPYMPYDNFYLPDSGDIQLAAVGFTKYGFPSTPVLANISLFGPNVISEHFATPTQLWTQTISAGRFYLDFIDQDSGWDQLNISLWDADSEVYATSIPAVDGRIEYHTLVSQSVDDGTYQVKIQAQQTVSGTTCTGLWSEFVPVLIDSTAPDGSTTLIAEVI
jgi:hypothetical protein